VTSWRSSCCNWGTREQYTQTQHQHTHPLKWGTPIAKYWTHYAVSTQLVHHAGNPRYLFGLRAMWEELESRVGSVNSLNVRRGGSKENGTYIRSSSTKSTNLSIAADPRSGRRPRAAPRIATATKCVLPGQTVVWWCSVFDLVESGISLFCVSIPTRNGQYRGHTCFQRPLPYDVCDDPARILQNLRKLANIVQDFAPGHILVGWEGKVVMRVYSKPVWW